MKSLIGSKTFWFNLVTLIVAVLALPELKAVLPADNGQAAAFVAAVLTVANLVLRLFTSTGISGRSSVS